MSQERPVLGAESEIALAKVNRSVAMTLAETPYPAILGSFVTIGCTTNIILDPPHTPTKPVRCGANPAAQLIPGLGDMGKLAFAGLDRAVENLVMDYHGEVCVARILTRLDNNVVRTYYCCYVTPRVTLNAPDGDEVGTISVEGDFHLLNEV